MKIKRILSAVAVLCLCCFACAPAAAADTPVVDFNIRVYDDADMLTDEQLSELSRMAKEYAEARQIDFVVVFTKDSLGKTPQVYAQDFYRENNFGYGETNDGVMLYVNMQERDIFVLTCGVCTDLMDTAVTDELYEQVKQHLTGGSASPGFDAAKAFIQDAARMFDRLYQPGATSPVKPGDQAGPSSPSTPYSKWSDPDEVMPMIGTALAIGFGVAGITVLIMRGVHNRGMVNPIMAAAYIKRETGAVRAAHQVDQFLHTHTTRTPIPKNNSSSGGRSGGGSHSFGGSGGKF